MTSLGIALLVLGYGVFYYGEYNLVSGGTGPTFAQTFNLQRPLQPGVGVGVGVGKVLNTTPSSTPPTPQAVRET